MNKFVFWFSLLSLAISFGLLITWIISSFELCKVDSDTFISSCIALITIAVTLVIGYQIYSTIEINRKLESVDELKNSLTEKYNELTEIGYNSLYRSFTSLAQANYANETESYKSFYYELQALYFGLLTHVERDELEKNIQNMEKYALKLMRGNGYFSGEEKSLHRLVDNYDIQISKYDSLIRKTNDFHIIKKEYASLFIHIRNRLNKIKNNQSVSLGSIYED